MVRKIILMSLVISFYTTELSGQCIANAGNDTIVCVNFGFFTHFIGGNPTAINGNISYTYTWEASYTIGSSTFTASYFLDDTTLANPEIINDALDSLTFYLTVTDNSGVICTDNIKVRFSNFVFSPSDNFAYINQGDSVQIYPAAGGGITPITYEWTPNYNLSDPNIGNPMASPDSTTYYSVTLTDSAGCQISGGDVFEVYVNPAAIEDASNQNIGISIYPNPFYGIFNISINPLQFDEAEVEVLDVTGKLVQKIILNNNTTAINLTDFPKGLYFVKIRIDNNIVVKKVVCQ